MFVCLSGGGVGAQAGECRGDVDVRPAVVKKKKKESTYHGSWYWGIVQRM